MVRDTHRDPIRHVREPAHPKYTKQDVAAGTKHEMEHTKDKRVAREIAISHLKEHFSYYRVLPAAEATMSAIENRPPGKIRKKRKRVIRDTGLPPNWQNTPW